MKKLTISLFLSLILIFSLLTQVSAATYFEVDGFSYLPTAEGDAVIYEYDNRQSDVVIPDRLLTNTVVEINNFAFLESTVTTVTFEQPSHLLSIGAYAFGYCSSLTSVTVPSSVVSIDPTAFYGSDNLTLSCYPGSYALQFARENNIPYSVITDYQLCDVNRDGFIDITDATDIQKNLVGILTFDSEQDYLAEVTGDGKVTVEDATYIQKLLVKLI